MVDRDPRISVEDVTRLAMVGAMLGGSALVTVGWHVKETIRNIAEVGADALTGIRDFADWNEQDPAWQQQPFHPARTVINAGRVALDVVKNMGRNFR